MKICTPTGEDVAFMSWETACCSCDGRRYKRTSLDQLTITFMSIGTRTITFSMDTNTVNENLFTINTKTTTYKISPKIQS